MKKLLLGIAGVIALIAPASAADLAARPYTKAPAMIAAVYDWSGFYIGVNGGWGSSHKCWDLVAPSLAIGPEGCHDATGGTIGGQIGYRWQAASWVFGVEGQGNWANFRGSNTSLLFAPDFNRSRVDAFGLITGQVGYAWNNVLFYVKGGGAVTGDKYDAFSGTTGVLLASANETRWGGTVGVGFEYGFAPNWSAGIEYDYLWRVSNSNTFLTPGLVAPLGIASITANTRSAVNMITGRINYHFNWGNPVVARY